MNLDDTLFDAQQKNGQHDAMSERAQAIKFVLRQGSNWPKMSIANKEALENTATRVAMILEGAMDDPHHWNRLARYARLRGKALSPIEQEPDQRARYNGTAAVREAVEGSWPHQQHKHMIPSTDEGDETAMAHKLAPRT